MGFAYGGPTQLPGLVQSRHENTHEQRNDGNHNEQLNQRETFLFENGGSPSLSGKFFANLFHRKPVYIT
jgi:hypothetical protein